MTRRGRAVVAMVAALAAVTAAQAGASPAPVAVNGTDAAFNDSIGINVHEFYPDTTYDDKPRLKQLLVDLGIKHVRDGLRLKDDDAARGAREFGSARDLAAAGIKFLWIAGNPDGPENRPDQVKVALTDPSRLAGTADALEGPNEYDGIAWRDSLWAQKLYAFMGQFYPYFKQDAAFASLPFYGPSFLSDSGRKTYETTPGAADLMDAPNRHPYAGGRAPEASIAAQATGIPAPYGDPTKLPAYTELGYHTAINSGNFGHYGVSERAQSIYLLRSLLAAYAAHIPRTYIYQLLDLKPDAGKVDPERQFGLVGVTGTAPDTTKADWVTTPKQAYGSLKELLSLTRDSGTDARPTSLPYSLSGAPSTMRSVLLSHSGGIVDLVLWNAVPVYNDPTWDCNDPRIPTNPPPPEGPCEYAKYHLAQDQGDAFPADVPVTLNLGEPADVSTERPHSERAFTQLGHGTSFNLSVGADPIVVRVKVSKYATEVRADSPSAWLRLAEPSGAATDSAGRGATTDPWVAAPTYGQASAVNDQDDRSVTVSGNQRVTVHVPTPLSSTSSSVELWVKPDPAVANFVEFLLADSPSWTERMRTYWPHDGAYWGSTYGSSSNEMLFTGFDYGQWHHVVLTLGPNGTSTTYLDGKKVGQTTGGTSFSTSWFTVGAFGGGGGFSGGIDELAVYPTVLSAARVCAHYRAAGGSC